MGREKKTHAGAPPHHTTDLSPLCGTVIEPNGVPHHMPQLAPSLRRHPLSHSDRCHPPRLRARDNASIRNPTPPILTPPSLPSATAIYSRYRGIGGRYTVGDSPSRRRDREQ